MTEEHDEDEVFAHDWSSKDIHHVCIDCGQEYSGHEPPIWGCPVSEGPFGKFAE